MAKVLIVNSKSSTHSRKNSLYKKFIQNANENKSNKLNFMSFTKIAKIFQPSNSPQHIIEGHKVTSPKHQSIIKQKSASKEKGDTR